MDLNANYNDPRYWILNPRGHRAYGSEFAPSVRDTVELFGQPAVIISSPAPDDVWICDLCNDPILINWGDEPFPVPLFGGNALCLDCFIKVQTWPQSDDWGEPIDGTELGEWPAHICNCPPCENQTAVWMKELRNAYGVPAK